jgi:hypothetical protein
MHAQQSFLNVCNTAILGYHGDKIILYKNVKNIKHVTNHRLLNYEICQDYLTIKYVSITEPVVSMSASQITTFVH